MVWPAAAITPDGWATTAATPARTGGSDSAGASGSVRSTSYGRMTSSSGSGPTNAAVFDDAGSQAGMAPYAATSALTGVGIDGWGASTPSTAPMTMCSGCGRASTTSTIASPRPNFT